MSSARIPRLVSCGLIVVVAGLCYALPARDAIPATTAAPPDPPARAERVVLSGVVRDFHDEHPDFAVVPLPDAVGHFTGAVEARLDAHGLPVLAAPGRRVDEQPRDAAQRPIPFHLAGRAGAPCGREHDDRPGRFGASGGSITSASSFAEWFRDTLGANISTGHAIELTRGPDGVFTFIDTEFFPVDHRLFGDEGRAHNHDFTFVVDATFLYEACSDQFIEVAGGDGLWVFVDDALAIDLGGVVTPTAQYLELDRLGLRDGVAHRLKVFLAQRNPSVSTFALRTNVRLNSTNPVASVINGFD